MVNRVVSDDRRARKRAAVAAWRARNPELDRERKRAWYQANGRRKSWERSLQVLYGMSVEQYDDLFLAQEGVCAICSRPELAQDKDGASRPLAVDHCHTTGAIRGLLCSRCNGGLGMFLDDPDLLAAAVLYLNAAKEA